MNKTVLYPISNSGNLSTHEAQSQESTTTDILTSGSFRNVENPMNSRTSTRVSIESGDCQSNSNINNRDVSATTTCRDISIKFEGLQSAKEQPVYKPLTREERRKQHNERIAHLTQISVKHKTELTEKFDDVISKTREMVNENDRLLESLADAQVQRLESTRLLGLTIVDELNKFNQSLEEAKQKIHENIETAQTQISSYKLEEEKIKENFQTLQSTFNEIVTDKTFDTSNSLNDGEISEALSLIGISDKI